MLKGGEGGPFSQHLLLPARPSTGLPTGEEDKKKLPHLRGAHTRDRSRGDRHMRETFNALGVAKDLGKFRGGASVGRNQAAQNYGVSWLSHICVCVWYVYTCMCLGRIKELVPCKG